MRVALVQRPTAGATPEDVLEDPDKYSEPVAILIVGYDIPADELHRISEAVLELVGNKVIDTEALERVFNSFLK